MYHGVKWMVMLYEAKIPVLRVAQKYFLIVRAITHYFLLLAIQKQNTTE